MSTVDLPDRRDGVGALLREWRERRRLSQLELDARGVVSARHLSAVETGRSRPTPRMILHLSEHLDVPLRERNRLLLAGGYAPAYAESELDAPPMAAVHEAIEHVLKAHRPNPALVIDRRWELVAANPSLAPLIDGVAPELLEPPVNVLRLSLHPDGLAPRIVNLAEWRDHLVGRLARSVETSGDADIAVLVAELRELCPDIGEDAAAGAGGRGRDRASGRGGRPGGGGGPGRGGGPDGVDGRREAYERPPHRQAVVVPLVLRHGDAELRLLSTTTVFGTPQDVTVAELAIETFFPGDAETARRLAALDPGD